MVATTMFGLEEVLANELKNLGGQDVKVGVRNVSFFGDIGFMYKANIALRTAIRILKPIKSFKVFDEDDFLSMSDGKLDNRRKTICVLTHSLTAHSLS